MGLFQSADPSFQSSQVMRLPSSSASYSTRGSFRSHNVGAVWCERREMRYLTRPNGRENTSSNFMSSSNPIYGTEYIIKLFATYRTRLPLSCQLVMAAQWTALFLSLSLLVCLFSHEACSDVGVAAIGLFRCQATSISTNEDDMADLELQFTEALRSPLRRSRTTRRSTTPIHKQPSAKSKKKIVLL